MCVDDFAGWLFLGLVSLVAVPLIGLLWFGVVRLVLWELREGR